ncbi:related to endo-1,3(4)-beta-glucanase [Phialocephala subalpina]|uniref:endo-1,3(4)-beta-glucanase n=1 Tax=Phialocephala subalpina TaxID=576137 RepID=A0A1L7XNY3_9HELO|nr:related to endo-1,3(4)-beta-glucanase [Phialocephala subalpina]
MIPITNSFAKFILATLFLRQAAASTYQLDTDYSGSSFFNGFSFFTQPDYTHGFVSYLNQTTASSQGLIVTMANGSVYMGVDHTSVLNPITGPGRASVRITSNKAWTHGLFILDLAHMPGTNCGSWPAYWMVGPNWPAGGEIDVIEGVNSNTLNQVSLHTNDNCSISGTNELGTMINPICQESASTGCGVLTSNPSSYGTPFNLASGGVYATEWTSTAIRLLTHHSTGYFPRSGIPADILAHSPDPSKWGLPQANMQGNCDIDKHFYQHQIVFDTTFCGDWAGSVWPWDPVCSVKAADCNTYVAKNPGAFADAYWMVNYLRVYTSVPAASSTSLKAAATSSSRAATTTFKQAATSTIKSSSSSSKATPSSTKSGSSITLISTKKTSSSLSLTSISTKSSGSSSTKKTSTSSSTSTLRSSTSSLKSSSSFQITRPQKSSTSSSSLHPNPTTNVSLPAPLPKVHPNHGPAIFARSGFLNVSSSVSSIIPAKSNAAVLASTVWGGVGVTSKVVVITSTGMASTTQSVSITTTMSKSEAGSLRGMGWKGGLVVMAGVVFWGL